MPLSTQPYRGARDFYPADMRIRNYIFNTWKQVCRKYGFEEYDFPILEPLEIFAAKSGEELVNDQLFSFKDRGGRKLAIRPELTPGTARMLAAKYGELTKPLRWFMIGNNWRYEKPQKGRGREFYQLEANIFGVSGVLADFEIFQLIIDLMKAFGANETMFQVFYSDRRLVVTLLTEYLKQDEATATWIRRVMDKKLKMTDDGFLNALKQTGVTEKQAFTIKKFMESPFENLTKVIPAELLQKNQGYQNLKHLTSLLTHQNLIKYCKFDPSIIRGFDYSDGLVYEAFDLNPDNRRSMFGGERFDKLIQLFNPNYDMPATGFAMGDYTLLEFLNGWNLLPTFSNDIQLFITFLDESVQSQAFKLADDLRNQGINIIVNLEPQKLDKQLKIADKKGIPFVAILGPDEVATQTVTLKKLQTGEQQTILQAEITSKLQP